MDVEILGGGCEGEGINMSNGTHAVRLVVLCGVCYVIAHPCIPPTPNVQRFMIQADIRTHTACKYSIHGHANTAYTHRNCNKHTHL